MKKKKEEQKKKTAAGNLFLYATFLNWNPERRARVSLSNLLKISTI